MQLTLSVVLLAGLAGADSVAAKPAVYENYRDAHQAAQKSHKPMLVILNPAEGDRRVDLDDVTRSAHRRELLNKYVVVHLDAGTEHGKVMHAAFSKKPLPRVVVIDKDQKWQIYKTSQPLNAEQWNVVLQSYEKGVKPAPVANPYPNCPYCR